MGGVVVRLAEAKVKRLLGRLNALCERLDAAENADNGPLQLALVDELRKELQITLSDLDDARLELAR